VQERRSLYWRLNWYRQSELEGALLLGRLVRHATDPPLVGRLTRHCADEARHAWLWMRTLQALDLPIVRIRRSYQSFYLDETSTPRTMTEVLALTHIFEHRVHRHFTEELGRCGLPETVRRTFRMLLRDEQAHLDWIRVWLSARPGVEEILERYRSADDRVVKRMTPFRDRLWDIEGLGEELFEEGDDKHHALLQELHAPQSQHPAQAAP
jgi:tRNA isopentenyl-2-thiomethyl-A-37 hydroxylase MiaE